MKLRSQSKKKMKDGKKGIIVKMAEKEMNNGQKQIEELLKFMQKHKVTRRLTKILEDGEKMQVILEEKYRCMPLLGDEKNVPNWKVSERN